MLIDESLQVLDQRGDLPDDMSELGDQAEEGSDDMSDIGDEVLSIPEILDDISDSRVDFDPYFEGNEASMDDQENSSMDGSLESIKKDNQRIIENILGEDGEEIMAVGVKFDYEAWKAFFKRNNGNEMKRHIISEFLRRKIQKETGKYFSSVPWSLLYYKKCLSFPPLKLLNSKRLDKVIDKLDETVISEESLLIIEIFDALDKKLEQSIKNWKLIGVSVMRRLSESDFEGWPSDIPLRNLKSLSIEKLSKLYSALDQIKPSENFLKGNHK